MDLTESLQAYPGDTNQINLQGHADQVYSAIASADSYNFMTGGGVLEVPQKDQASQLQCPPISEEGPAGPSGPSGRLLGTLYTNQHPPTSREYPSHSPSTVPKSNWENLNGGSLFSNSSMQNILIGGNGMMTAPTAAATAQLLIGGLQAGGSFSGGGHNDHVGSVYYTSPAENQQEPNLEQLYYVSPAGYNSNVAGFHADGRDPASAATILYPTHDDGTVQQASQCDQSQQQFRVDPFLVAAAGGIPLPLQEHSGGSANQNFNWRNGGNELSFLPMNEDSQNHQSQFDTEHHVAQFNVSDRACLDLSHMQQTDHMTNHGTVGLHMERLKGISVNGQGLSLSLSSNQSQFHSAGGQLPDQADHMAAIGQAAAMAKTKELASRYLTGNSADLSRFRTQPTEDALMGTRFLQEHIDSAGRKHLASSTLGGPSGAGSSSHVSASRFLGSAQAILNEVCRVTAMKRLPRPARSSEHQQNNWSNMAGGSSTSVGGNFTYNGKEDSTRTSILTEVDSGRTQLAPQASAFNIHTTPLVTVSHIPLESEMIQGLADAARTQNREDLESKKQKLSLMADEVEVRYRRYCDQLQFVITSFNAHAGPNTATPYTILALQAMSRHFRCLRDAIGNQLKIVRRALGEDVDRNAGLGETSRLRYVDQQIRQQRALQQLGMLQQHAWRPQRGLPERAVSVLRAWLFEHFLHPYPKDVDKLSLAKQTGLTRSQVSNWFINARVRLWKPMVEEMYVEEQKENEERQAAEKLARDQAEIEKGTYEQYEGDRGNSGLLHEVSANAQPPRIANGINGNDDREHLDNGPVIVTGVGGTIAEVHSHPDLVSIGQRLDVDVPGDFNQDGREAKKARTDSASDVFKPNSSLMHSGMNIEGFKPVQEAKNFQGEECHVKDDSNFGIQSQAMKQNNHDQNDYSHVSQQGIATVDHIQPHVAAGTFGAFDSHDIAGQTSYGNNEPELSGYATRSASATSTGTVSLTLGLRHCEVHQHIRSSMVSPNGNLSKPYDMGAINDHMNQLNSVDLYEGRIGDVSHNGQSTSTAMNNAHYLQHAEEKSNKSNNSNNSNNSNSQQPSPPRRELNAAN